MSTTSASPMTRRSSTPNGTSTTKQSGASCSSAMRRGAWPSSSAWGTSRSSASSNGRRWIKRRSPRSRRYFLNQKIMRAPETEPFSFPGCAREARFFGRRYLKARHEGKGIHVDFHSCVCAEEEGFRAAHQRALPEGVHAAFDPRLKNHGARHRDIQLGANDQGVQRCRYRAGDELAGQGLVGELDAEPVGHVLLEDIRGERVDGQAVHDGVDVRLLLELARVQGKGADGVQHIEPEGYVVPLLKVVSLLHELSPDGAVRAEGNKHNAGELQLDRGRNARLQKRAAVIEESEEWTDAKADHLLVVAEQRVGN